MVTLRCELCKIRLRLRKTHPILESHVKEGNFFLAELSIREHLQLVLGQHGSAKAVGNTLGMVSGEWNESEALWLPGF